MARIELCLSTSPHDRSLAPYKNGKPTGARSSGNLATGGGSSANPKSQEMERLEQELADLRRRLTLKEEHVEAFCRLFAELGREKLCRYCRVDLAGETEVEKR